MLVVLKLITIRRESGPEGPRLITIRSDNDISQAKRDNYKIKAITFFLAVKCCVIMKQRNVYVIAITYNAKGTDLCLLVNINPVVRINQTACRLLYI
jgi:hypothetical protein